MLLGDKNYQSAYLGKHAIGMQTNTHNKFGGWWGANADADTTTKELKYSNYGFKQFVPT